jgi:hypothetical protein
MEFLVVKTKVGYCNNKLWAFYLRSYLEVPTYVDDTKGRRDFPKWLKTPIYFVLPTTRLNVRISTRNHREMPIMT